VDIAADANFNAATTNQVITISTSTAIIDAANGNSFEIYPNPFESTSSVHFELSTTSSVILEVYDLNGHKINALLNNPSLASGAYEIPLANLPIGMYFVKLKVGNFEKNLKVIKN
jgi:hypothetical protein